MYLYIMSKKNYSNNDKLKDYIDLYINETTPAGKNIDELEELI